MYSVDLIKPNDIGGEPSDAIAIAIAIAESEPKQSQTLIRLHANRAGHERCA